MPRLSRVPEIGRKVVLVITADRRARDQVANFAGIECRLVGVGTMVELVQRFFAFGILGNAVMKFDQAGRRPVELRRNQVIRH